MDEQLIDIPFQDDNKQYYTIDDVSKILKLEQSRIIFYYEKLNDFLNIASIGMYQVFEQTDIDNLRKIKELNIDKNMDISETRIYLNSHKQEILLNKQNQELDISNKSFADFLIRVLNNQNQKIDVLVENGYKTLEVINQMNQHQENLENEINLLTDKINSMEEYSKNELAITQETNKRVEEKLDNNNKIIEENTKSINEFRCITLDQIKEQSQPKSFLDRIFHKKK